MTDFEKAPPWRDEEYAFLADHPHLAAREVAEALGRTVSAVEKKRGKVGRGWEPSRDHWSTEDIDFVRDNPMFTSGQIASVLGKTFEQVAEQRKRLRKREGISFGGQKIPYHVGARTLLAKTCPACGYFLPAQWFPFHNEKGGYWQTKCSRCRNAEAPPRERTSRGDVGDATRRLQALSLDTATRKSEPWLESDHIVLADESLTVIEKAIRLQRTYYATQHLLRENGYRSRIGLGAREAAAWLIRFREEAA